MSMRRPAAMIALAAVTVVGGGQLAWAGAELRSVPANPPKAVKQDVYGKDGLARWLPKAEKGDVFAQYVLGHMYCEGKRVKQDFGAGLKWYKRAAAQGFAPGQLALGSLYYEGKGVKQDYTEAAHWFHLAADQGYDRAQNNLASLYYEGKGVKQDFRAALHWYRAAAVQGYKSAQYSLGVMYFQGVGLAHPDQVTGFALLRLLQDQGEHQVDKVVKSATRLLSKAQIAASQKLAERMRSKDQLKVILTASNIP